MERRYRKREPGGNGRIVALLVKLKTCAGIETERHCQSMNFLAHLQLAEPTAESCLGNLLGDFVKGYPWDDRFSEAVWRGIMEHRYVDAYTDQHEMWNRSRDLLPEEYRRFAGIVVDIYYDYFLHRHWARFSPNEDLETFLERVESELLSIQRLAPEEARDAFQKMREQQWLREYATLEGIDRTLVRVRSRAPFLEPIFETSRILREHLPQLEEHFLQFYPDLIQYVDRIRRALKSSSIEAKRRGRLP